MNTSEPQRGFYARTAGLAWAARVSFLLTQSSQTSPEVMPVTRSPTDRFRLYKLPIGRKRYVIESRTELGDRQTIDKFADSNLGATFQPGALDHCAGSAR